MIEKKPRIAFRSVLTFNINWSCLHYVSRINKLISLQFKPVIILLTYHVTVGNFLCISETQFFQTWMFGTN